MAIDSASQSKDVTVRQIFSDDPATETRAFPALRRYPFLNQRLPDLVDQYS